MSCARCLAIGLAGLAIGAWATHPATAAMPMGTAFTYQGLLEDGGGPVTNTSPGCDFEFTLWDDPSAGSQIGGTESKGGVSVSDGVITVDLDFSAGSFNG